MQFRELPSDRENYTRIITIDYQREENKITLTLRDEASYDVAIACLSTYRFLSIAEPDMQLGTIDYSGDRLVPTITISATNPAQLLDSLCSTHTISKELYTGMLRQFEELKIRSNSISDRGVPATSVATDDDTRPLLVKV